MCHGSGALWWSVPACLPRIARGCGSVTGFSSSLIADRRRARSPARAAPQADWDGFGCLWARLAVFCPEDYITRLSAVLDAEPQVFQVGINYGDAAKLTNACAAEQ